MSHEDQEESQPIDPIIQQIAITEREIRNLLKQIAEHGDPEEAMKVSHIWNQINELGDDRLLDNVAEYITETHIKNQTAD